MLDRRWGGARWVVALGVLGLVAGCSGAARYVVRDAEGGLLALDGERGPARGDAERQMREHCGAGGYEVTAEGDYTVAVVRTPTITNTEAAARLADDQTGRSSAALPGMPGSSVATAGAGTSGDVDGPTLYDSAQVGSVPRIPEPVREHRIEYECTRR